MGAIRRLIDHLERSLLVSIYVYISQAIVDLEPFPSTVNPSAYLSDPDMNHSLGQALNYLHWRLVLVLHEMSPKGRDPTAQVMVAARRFDVMQPH